MVLDRLILLLSDFETHLVYLPIYQPPISDDNNISLLINRKLFILKFNSIVCLIILHSS